MLPAFTQQLTLVAVQWKLIVINYCTNYIRVYLIEEWRCSILLHFLILPIEKKSYKQYIVEYFNFDISFLASFKTN